MKNRTLAPLLVVVALSVTAAPALAKEGLGVVGTIGAPGSGPGEFSLAPFGVGNGEREDEPGSGVAVNSAGDVYVADTGNHRVEWFGPEAANKFKFEGEFDGSGSLANEAGKKAPAPLSQPEAVAVDNDPASPSFEDVYVADRSEGVIDKFSATGEFIFQLKVPSVSSIAIDPSGDIWVRASLVQNTSVQEFSNAIANTLTYTVKFPGTTSPEVPEFGWLIAVDSEENLYLTISTHEVGKYSKTGAFLGTVCGIKCADGLAIDVANNDLFVDSGSAIAQFGPFGEPFEAPQHASKPSTLSEAAGLAVGPSHKVYVADPADDNIVIFAYGPPPEAPETLAAKEVKGNSAILEGELGPNGETGEVQYHFVYSTEGTCTGAADAGTAPVPAGSVPDGSRALVHAEATNLEPLAEYTYCLVAENNFAEEIGSPETFKTPAAAPKIISESAFNEKTQFGGFSAVINPNNEETTYFFEYSKEASTNGSGELELEGEIQKTGEAALPAAFSEEPVTKGDESFPLKKTLYYRVVTKNEAGEEKGKVQAYTKLPIVTEVKASNPTSLGATLEAMINPDYQETTYAFEYATGSESGTGEEVLEAGEGIRTGSATLPENLNEAPFETPLNPKKVPHVSAEATLSVEPGKTYYYRVVAENGTSRNAGNINEGKPVYSPIGHFTTYAGPAATTGEAGAITGTSATLSGEVDPNGEETTYSFEYISEAGYQTAVKRGDADPFAEGEASAPVSAGSGETSVAAGPVRAAGLSPEETYRYRLVATDRAGVQGIGGDLTFKTESASPPSVSTGAASAVSQNLATLSGTVTTNGLQTSYGFEIGTTPGDYGPATGLGAIGGSLTEEVHVTLGELQPGTTYYYRVTATNADGTTQGEPGTFTTPGFPSLLAAPVAPPQIAIPATAFPTDVTESATPGKTKTKTKPKTRAQKLAKALKQCHRKPKMARAACEKQAHSGYGSARKKR